MLDRQAELVAIYNEKAYSILLDVFWNFTFPPQISALFFQFYIQ